MIFSSTVSAAFDRCLLLDYLRRRFTYLTEAEWRGYLDQGCISRNGQACPAEAEVCVGDLVAFSLDAATVREPPADLAFQIIYEDDWLLGINKPGNLLVHRQGRSLTHNLIYQLRYAHTPPYPQAGVVNRLDRETSGVVLVARQPEFLGRLNLLFSRHEVVKTYLAVVGGCPEPRQGVVDVAIGRDGDSVIAYRYCTGTRALAPKEASTRYEVVSCHGSRSLVRLAPTTGRTHQLRVHLAHLGHPILGDKLYGRTDQEFVQWRQRPQDGSAAAPRRQALHAERLAFVHPWTGKELSLVAEMPADMQQWLDGEGEG